jgi:hypothetical protein
MVLAVHFFAGAQLPLTLTLSPQAGRGDVPHAGVKIGETSAAYLLRPACGEKVADRPDEGPCSFYKGVVQ